MTTTRLVKLARSRLAGRAQWRQSYFARNNRSFQSNEAGHTALSSVHASAGGLATRGKWFALRRSKTPSASLYDQPVIAVLSTQLGECSLCALLALACKASRNLSNGLCAAKAV